MTTNSADVRRKLLDSIDERDDDGDGAPIGDVFEDAADVYGAHDAADALSKLVRTGEVYQPTTTTIRLTKR